MESRHNIAYALVTPDDAFKTDPDLAKFIDVLSAAIMKTFTFLQSNMHYIVAGVFLNPVLFLHGINALLTLTKEHLKLPYMISSYIEPHIDINDNPAHATAFVLFVIFAQWHAFSRCLDIANQQSVVSGKANLNAAGDCETDED